MMPNAKMMPNEKKKRIRAKGWFCTWPKCDASKEYALEMLKMDHQIVEYVICQEDHQDGSKHLHGFLKMEKTIEFKPNLFDFAEYHGNYQPAKSWRAVIAYVKKDGDFISSFNVENALQKKAKEAVAAKNKLLLNTDVKALVDEGEISILTVPRLLSAKRAYENAGVPPIHSPRKCFWIYGSPRVGKSFVVREMFPDLYEKSQNKWWDGYCNEKYVLIDDFDKQGECLGHLLKIWADNYRFLGEIKGGSIYIKNVALFVTSNYRIEEIFGDEKVRDAIMCRFMMLNLLNREGQEIIKREINKELNIN